MEKGKVWCVGRGDHILIWEDPWIIFNDKTTPLKDLIEPNVSWMKLSEVIENSTWKREFLLSLPLPIRDIVNLIPIRNCYANTNGKYSSKSAYNKCLEEVNCRGESSEMANTRDCLRSI